MAMLEELKKKTPAELTDMLCLPEDADPWVANFAESMRAQRRAEGNSMWVSMPQLKKLRALVNSQRYRR